MLNTRLLILVILMSSGTVVFAQLYSPRRSPRPRMENTRVTLSDVKFNVKFDDNESIELNYGDEGLPSFDGGYKCFEDYILECVTYPIGDFENGIQGRVVASVKFNHQDDKLKLEDVVILKGFSRNTDNECKRLLLDCPEWKIEADSKYKTSDIRMRVALLFRILY